MERHAFRPAPAAPRLERALPVTAEIRRYRASTARRDIVAAVTVAAVAVPAAMAYAEVAGLSPVNGLYALLVPTLAYGLLGSSRQLVVGPDGSISALVGASVLGVAAAGSAHALGVAGVLALLVAACFAVARLARLAWIADYLSRPVLIGYVHGVAVVLIISQLPKLLGIEVTAVDPVRRLVQLVLNLGDAVAATALVGVAALAVLLGLRAVAPRAPGALAVVIAGIVASSAFALADHGVALVGAIPSGLPELGLPSLSWGDGAALVPAAAGLFLVIFADGVLTARRYAEQHGQRVDAQQELVALGGANLAAGLTQAFPVGASGSRTGVSDAVGVRTQVGAMLAAGAVVVVLLFLTDPIADLPTAVLGAVIVSAALGLVDVAAWRDLAADDRVELAIAAVTAAGVVVTGVLPALAFAVGLSIVDVVRRSARPHDAVLGWAPELGRYADVAAHETDAPVPGVVVYRVDDRLFFANAGYVKARVHDAVRAAPSATHRLVLDAEAITHVDAAGLAAVRDLDRTLAAGGTTLVFARMKPAVRARFDTSGLTADLGDGRFYPTVRSAVGWTSGTSPGAPSTR